MLAYDESNQLKDNIKTGGLGACPQYHKEILQAKFVE